MRQNLERELSESTENISVNIDPVLLDKVTKQNMSVSFILEAALVESLKRGMCPTCGTPLSKKNLKPGQYTPSIKRKRVYAHLNKQLRAQARETGLNLSSMLESVFQAYSNIFRCPTCKEPVDISKSRQDTPITPSSSVADSTEYSTILSNPQEDIRKDDEWEEKEKARLAIARNGRQHRKPRPQFSSPKSVGVKL